MVDMLTIKSFFLAGLVSFILTPFVRRLCLKMDWMDVPKDARRVHKKPIPRIGGIAIYLAFLLGILVYCPLNRESIGLLVGASVIVLSGFIDDTKGLTPRGKLIFQALAALCLVWGGSSIEFFTNPTPGHELVYLGYLGIPLTIFWVAGITNSINLIDGLDGLASGVTMISAISLLFIAQRYQQTQVVIVAAVLAGACLGFLFFNFNPASIFMGDTGALLLGFVLSYISIEGVMKSVAAIAIFLPVIILGVPIFDTTFAMLRRAISGRGIMSADKGHLHHRLLNKGLSQRETVAVLYLISILFGVLANIVSQLPAKDALTVCVIIVVLVFLLASLFGMFSNKGTQE